MCMLRKVRAFGAFSSVARGNGLEFGFGFGRKRYESIVMDLREDVGLRLCLCQMICSNDQEHAEEIGVWIISQIVDYFYEFAGSEHMYRVPPARYSDEIPTRVWPSNYFSRSCSSYPRLYQFTYVTSRIEK